MRNFVDVIHKKLDDYIYQRDHVRRMSSAERTRTDSVIARNQALWNSCEGRKGLILGNGMSVADYDTTALRGIDVISVSTGYFHKNYDIFRPRFHCLPEFEQGRFTDEAKLAYLREMDQHIFAEKIFFSAVDEPFITEHNPFPGRQVHYLSFEKSFDRMPPDGVIDISKPVPAIISAPIMALLIMMHMGYKSLYLLGFDHDSLKTGKYFYPYDVKITKGSDYSIDTKGKSIAGMYSDLHNLAQLWRQYRFLRTVAEQSNISIYNLSEASELDEFPRLPFDAAVKEP